MVVVVVYWFGVIGLLDFILKFEEICVGLVMDVFLEIGEDFEELFYVLFLEALLLDDLDDVWGFCFGCLEEDWFGYDPY